MAPCQVRTVWRAWASGLRGIWDVMVRRSSSFSISGRRRSCAGGKVGGLVPSGARPFCRWCYGMGRWALLVGRGALHFCLWRPVGAADGCGRFPRNTAPPPGRPENGVTGPGRGSGARVVGVIWATGPKQGVGAAGECALEGLRGPQAGCGGGGRLGGPRGPGLPVRRR